MSSSSLIVRQADEKMYDAGYRNIVNLDVGHIARERRANGSTRQLSFPK